MYTTLSCKALQIETVKVKQNGVPKAKAQNIFYTSLKKLLYLYVVVYYGRITVCTQLFILKAENLEMEC